MEIQEMFPIGSRASVRLKGANDRPGKMESGTISAINLAGVGIHVGRFRYFWPWHKVDEVIAEESQAIQSGAA